MFSQASVILFTGGVYPSACWDTPPDRPPRQTPPRADTHTPQADTPHPNDHCSGRYASYWDAFLLSKCERLKIDIIANEGHSDLIFTQD